MRRGVIVIRARLTGVPRWNSPQVIIRARGLQRHWLSCALRALTVCPPKTQYGNGYCL
eukprot:COSAG01_NODE_7959_length_2975_cov_8.739917_4_plen_58_part_00